MTRTTSRTANAGGSLVLGLVLIVVGTLLVLDNLAVIEVELTRLIVPVVLVIVGGSLLHAGWRVRTAQLVDGDPAARHDVGAAARTAGDASRGPSATAVFGDARLVLPAGDEHGERHMVTVTAAFGDVQIEVPATWRIVDHLTRVVGDVSVTRDQPADLAAPTVELYGLVLFGDVKVRAVGASEPAR
ncbi:MAG: hypothetical protein ACLFRD_01425 [Nitriliruptoraceae bacterium]